MHTIEIIIRGLIAGLGISAPVGPVNILCISKAVSKGRRAALLSGLGAGAADTIYGSIAAFSISYVIHFLVREEFWIRLVGGSLLIAIGILYYFRRPQSLEKTEEASGSDFLHAFFLTLTNPTTVLSFLAVLAALGMGGYRGWFSLYLVAGIFTGSMAWWTFLALVASRFKNRVDDRSMLWMNRIAGFAIGGFGIVTVILSRGHPR
jgi:threonine/homoserine/homoserine lactone efflux protein